MVTHNCREDFIEGDLPFYPFPQVSALVTTNNFK